ncbi:MAG TPA: LssY C-terminal domain-containing protein [Xanthobacteraceae bacterium]|nr:LssY C-terminal domain-containing protein [Xanthobacteraceae bacterium]
MARMLIRLLRRLLVLALGVLSVWLIVFVFRLVDRGLPSIVAVALSYAAAAYVVLPYTVLISLKVLHRKRVPSYTLTGDGLPGDPVNLILVGTMQQLHAAFAEAGWSPADPLNLASAWRMARAFVFNSPYPTAPFSALYLFGRAQDIGFQKQIGDSPRKRHHVRFWAAPLAREAALGEAGFWRSAGRPPADARVLWIGAGTKDTGFSLTHLTFQISHATDSDTNVERDFIIEELAAKKLVDEVKAYRAGQRLPAAQVNHYITDGEVTAATLIVDA